MSRTVGRGIDDRETFDAALDAYRYGCDHERLLQAAGKVIDCSLPIAPEHGDTISVLTDHLDVEIETYGDAADAIRRWFATEPGREGLTKGDKSDADDAPVDGLEPFRSELY